jgi:hypothetical protein
MRKKYEICSNHDVYEDSYEEGELNAVNTYDMRETIYAEDPMKAIEKYFGTVLNRSIDVAAGAVAAVMDCGLIDEDGRTFYYSYAENKYGEEPSEEETASWKEGKTILYSNNVSITISELVPVDLRSMQPVNELDNKTNTDSMSKDKADLRSYEDVNLFEIKETIEALNKYLTEGR